MMRITLEGVLLFLAPFMAYLAFVTLGPRLGLPQRGPFGAARLGLAACGICLVIVALVALGVFADRSKGAYVPAHIENGRLVPGQLR